MKQTLIALGIIMTALAFAAPGRAAWYRLGRSSAGIWLVSDLIKPAGDFCHITRVGLIYPHIRPDKWGVVKSQVKTMRVCCNPKTIQTLAITYRDPKGKIIRTRSKPFTPDPYRPGNMGSRIIDFVCTRAARTR